MSYSKITKLTNEIVDEFKNNTLNKNIIQSNFNDCIIIFGNILYKNQHIKNPYIKAYKQLIKYIQIKLNKLPIKYNISEYVTEPLKITVFQLV